MVNGDKIFLNKQLGNRFSRGNTQDKKVMENSLDKLK